MTDGNAGALKHWRHKKRGTTYTEVGTGSLQASDGVIGDGEFLVIYRSDTDGSLWARPFNEFHDGRFEALSPAPVERRETTGEMEIAHAMNDVLNAMVDAKEEMTTTRITARVLGDRAVRAAILALPCPDEAAIREKCAKIAEHINRQREWVNDPDVYASPTRRMQRAIAAAIRKGDAL